MTEKNESVSDADKTTENASGDASSKKDHVSYETYQKLLAQRKKDQERLSALEKERQDFDEKKKIDEETKLNEKGEYKKLIELREQKIAELNEKIGQFENKSKHLEEQLLTRKKLEAFYSKLPARLMDNEYLKLVDFDEIAVDPDTKEIDDTSLDKVVGSFIKKHGRLLETKKTTMPNEATTAGSKIEYDAWLKLPFKEQKNYKWSDLKNVPK